MRVVPERGWDLPEGRPCMKMAAYQFQSCFAPYIEKFLQEKRDAGFLYESAEWKLKHFDAFCVKESVTEPVMSRELVKKW